MSRCIAILLLIFPVVFAACGRGSGVSQPEWQCKPQQLVSSSTPQDWLAAADGVKRFNFPLTSNTQVAQTRERSSAGESVYHELSQVNQDIGELFRLRLDQSGCTDYFTHLRAGRPQNVLVRLVRRENGKYLDLVMTGQDADGNPKGYDLATKGPVEKDFKFNLTQGELTFKLINGEPLIVVVDMRTGEQRVQQPGSILSF